MLVCTFAGHRQVFAADVAQKARDALERLVEIDRELTFYNRRHGRIRQPLRRGGAPPACQHPERG